MATIGLRNRRLRDLQCTVRDRKRRVPTVHVVLWARPSGVKVSIGILWPMQKVPAIKGVLLLSSSSSVLEPKSMGKRKRDANGKIIPSPSDSKPRPNRNRPGRRNGSENAKTEQNRVDETLALELAPELCLRKCNACHVTKPVDSYPVPVSTSIQEAYKSCTACLEKMKADNLANGITSYMLNRERVRSLLWQSEVKANLFGTEGYEDYAAACLEANPEKTPQVPKPRCQLDEMIEKTPNHGMFTLILSCLLQLSNILLAPFLEV